MDFHWWDGTAEDHLAAIKLGVFIIAKCGTWILGYLLFRVLKESITKDARWM